MKNFVKESGSMSTDDKYIDDNQGIKKVIILKARTYILIDENVNFYEVNIITLKLFKKDKI